MLFSIFQSIAGAFAITVENYTGIWIPQRDVYPFAVIACENLSNKTKYTLFQYSIMLKIISQHANFIFYGELSNFFAV